MTNKTIKKILFSTTILVLFISIIFPISAIGQAYNAQVVLDLDWDADELQDVVVSRDEVTELELELKFKINTGDYFGKGLVMGYTGKTALINIDIIDKSSWCYTVLEVTRVELNISLEGDSTNIKLFLLINENAPAYGNGFIKIKAQCPQLALLKGFEKEFELHFSPAYIPIIRTDLPETNTKRIKPEEKAVFPIDLENAGNARTIVIFDIQNVPDGWSATISDEVILDEGKGSKAQAYLTVVPPSDLGFHYEEANIRVKITPARAEDPDETGNPLYANFIVQNRGSTSQGIENYLFWGLIVFIFLAIALLMLRGLRKKSKKKSS